MSNHNHQGSTAPASSDSEWVRPAGSGISDVIKMFVLSWLIMAPIFAFGGRRVYQTWRTQEDARQAVLAATMAHEWLLEAPALPMLPVENVAHGRDLFATTCAACHGADAKGLKGLGRDLVESDFIAQRSDREMHEFLLLGRPDAKPLPMPARGGRDDLTDDDLSDVLAYVRALQDSRRMPANLPPPVAPTISEADTAAALAAAGGDEELAAYIASGARIYASSCIACHGAAGKGMPGNGKPLAGSEMLATMDDEEMLEFIMRGRDAGDPANTTGILMPPKGGNPALSEDDILDIISYLRSLPPVLGQNVGLK